MRYESPYGQTIHLDLETYLSLTDDQLNDLCVNMTRYSDYQNIRVGNSKKREKETKQPKENNTED